MSYYLTGHYGTGKTLLAAEVVKIWLGRFLETNKEVDAFVLAYEEDKARSFKYALLLQELRDKYFPDENQVQVSDWHKFMDQFTQTSSNSPIKKVFRTVAKFLNKTRKKVIIMVDEIELLNAYNEKTENDGKISYKLDFSYLRQFENVHFILCLRPASNIDNYELTFPDQQGQLYKNLGLRHRSALEILNFLRFWQEKNHGMHIDYSPCIHDEKLLPKESLPPLLEGLIHGVI